MSLRIGVLGPLHVFDGEHEVLLASGKQQVLLACLALAANRTVPLDELAETLWGANPPPAAEMTLRNYVRRLRHALGPSAAARLSTGPGGYRLALAEHELDALEFEDRCRAAFALPAGGWAERRTALAGALGLWRGRPLADVESQLLRDAHLPRLELLRTEALERRIEADLELGRHGDLVAELRELVREQPLNERLHAQLISALARSGRRAEALAAYRHARGILVEELSVEPGAELQAMHQRVLSGEDEPSLPLPAEPGAPTDRAAPQRNEAEVPRQLPAAPGHFTGRHDELRRLIDIASGTAPHSGTVVISAIDGMAGIGKTALALHAAHQLAPAYPDGQLFVDLHGYTEGHPPRAVGDALGWLLQVLGVPPYRIPKDSEDAAALYRQCLADTKTLIVLDNAAEEAQVRPLLPGTASCLVLVTSRRRLRALDDSHIVSLDFLSPPESCALLRSVAGPGRIPAEDPLLDEIAGLCGYLPLALRLAGALLRHRSAWSLAHLADLLRDQGRRVASLRDGERSLAAVFDLSYTGLDAPRQRLWRRLGLVPGPDLDSYAAAALSEADPATAGILLDDLVDHNLLIEYAPGRFRLHDLMRIHARSLAATDSAAERAAALNRLLYFYAYTAQSVSLQIARYPRPGPTGPAPAHVPSVPDPEAARAWARAERPNLEAAFAFACTEGLDGHAVALAAGLAEIMQIDGPWTRALEFHQAAAETADRLGDLAAHATALTDSGHALQAIGDFAECAEAFTRALEVFRALGNRLGEANATNELGAVRDQLGDDPQAAADHLRALEIYRALGNRLGEAGAMHDLGRVYKSIGDHPQAIEAFSGSLDIYRALGSRLGEANTLFDLARTQESTGDFAGAADVYTRSLEIYRDLGSRLGEANALCCIGLLRYKTGDYAMAADAHTRALETFCTLGNRNGEANALNNIALVWLNTGDYAKADDALIRALEVYRELGDRLSEAAVLSDQGRLWEATGDYARAAEAHTSALEIFRALGNRSFEGSALNCYASTLAATGQRARAFETYLQALAINRELNTPEHEAVSLEGIADHHLALGDTAQGTAHLYQALEIYQRLSMAPDAERVRDRLSDQAE